MIFPGFRVAPLLGATNNYYDNGLVKDVQYSNVVMALFQYHAADRLSKIDRRDPLDAPILTHTYSHLDNKLQWQIAEFAVGFPHSLQARSAWLAGCVGSL